MTLAHYPRLPDQRIIVGGVDISERFNIALIDGYELSPPDVKTYTVDIPGGNGVIDLTEALTGDVAYEQREQSFEFKCIYPESFERVKTQLSDFLHGRSFDYQLSFDPGYTYHGRFKVNTYSHEGYVGGIVGDINITVTADPYKLKEHCAYRLNATGGRLYRFESGRRPVHPTIECESVCFVTWDGETITVPAGTYRLNDVVFREGFNELYVNTCKLFTEHWTDVANGGADAMTWAEAHAMTWDDLQRLGLADAAGVPQAWSDIALDTWASHAEGGETPRTWRDLDYRRTEAAQGSATAYLTYDWEDL